MTLQSISKSQSAPAGSFFAQLKPASYRGVPFGTKGGQSKFGRKNAVHEYPFRDVAWTEDLGRQARRFQVTGFLVGDDVIARRDRLIAACEKPGDGELIHPTFGRLTVALLEFTTSEHWEQGRVFEITFSFIEQGARQFPGAATSSETAIQDAANTSNEVAAATFSRKVKAAAPSIGALAPLVSNISSAWSSSGVSAVNNANGPMNIAAAIPGNFGRLLGQSSGLPFSKVNSDVSPPTVAVALEAQIGAAAAARASVSSAGSALSQSSGAVTTASLDSYSSLAISYAAAARAATFTPADALRVALAMATTSSSADAVSGATADLLRRLAVAQAALASAAYQPSTSQEAAQVRDSVLAAIHNELRVAGDQGDDDAYAALRILRAQVTADMNAKGARLPALVTIKTPASVPSLVLAQRLYRDPERADELVRRANPRHPAFMPLQFLALAS